MSRFIGRTPASNFTFRWSMTVSCSGPSNKLTVSPYQEKDSIPVIIQ
ncbi:MAG: hypothetical protein ACYC2P_09255 [Paludibacteraceae bacterium]